MKKLVIWFIAIWSIFFLLQICFLHHTEEKLHYNLPYDEVFYIPEVDTYLEVCYLQDSSCINLLFHEDLSTVHTEKCKDAVSIPVILRKVEIYFMKDSNTVLVPDDFYDKDNKCQKTKILSQEKYRYKSSSMYRFPYMSATDTSYVYLEKSVESFRDSVLFYFGVVPQSKIAVFAKNGSFYGRPLRALSSEKL